MWQGGDNGGVSSGEVNGDSVEKHSMKKDRLFEKERKKEGSQCEQKWRKRKGLYGGSEQKRQMRGRTWQTLQR